MKNRSNYVHELKYSKKMKSTIVYITLFILLLVVSSKVQFGQLIFGLVIIMGTVGAFVAHIVPNDSEGTLKAFKVTTSGFLLYVLLIFLIREYLAKIGVVISIMDTIYIISIIMTPLGYITWQVKKIAQLKGIGMSKRKTISYYKDHGNDGVM